MVPITSAWLSYSRFVDFRDACMGQISFVQCRQGMYEAIRFVWLMLQVIRNMVVVMQRQGNPLNRWFPWRKVSWCGGSHVC